MFIWETKTLFEGLKVHMPELYDSMAIISDRIKKKKTMMTFGRKLIQNQSIMVFLKKLITFLLLVANFNGMI